MPDPELFHETALSQPEPGEERPEYGDPEDGGDLLEKGEKEVVDYVTGRWDSQTPILKPFIEQWKVNVLRRKGLPGVRIRDGVCHIPKGATSPDAVPTMNKQADTLRRLGALLFSDPPASEAVPDSDSDDDKDAAEFATQVLEEIDGESQLDDTHAAEESFDRGNDYGSGFIEYYVDPKGGSRVPVEVKAGFDPRTGRTAETVDEAVYLPEHAAVGMQVEWPDYKPRFVRKDGSLTDSKAEAATRWAPKIKSRIYSSKNVRFLPISAKDLWEADGVIITDFPSYQEVMRDYPEMKDLAKDELQQICSAMPTDHADIMSAAELRARNAKAKEDKPVWRMRLFHRQCEAYPQGAKITILGGRKMMEQEPWVAKMPDGTIEHLDIPLTQYAHLEEGGRAGAYKVGMSEVIGGADELRKYIWAQVIHNLERIRNQKVLLPSMGKIHSKMMQRAGKNILPFQPGYKPEYEQIPDLPSIVMEAFERISLEIDDASGLQQAARGLEDSSVKSGRHAFAIISQVKQGLSALIRNIERGWVRGGRIKLQLIRAFYTNEQQLLWGSDDDEWKQKAWKRGDLGSTRDVRLKAGTLTMFSAAQKEALAFEWHAAGLIDDQRLHEIVSSNMGATLGLQQDPRRSRIKRQLNQWLEGPPENWQPTEPMMQPSMNRTIDPLTGAVISEEPILETVPGPMGLPVEQQKMEPVLDPGGKPMYEPDPVLQRIFEPVPADVVPKTAQLRFDLIAEAMNRKAYLGMHPAWRSGLDQEFYRMQQAVAAAQAAMQPQAPAGGGGSSKPPERTESGSFTGQQMGQAA